LWCAYWDFQIRRAAAAMLGNLDDCTAAVIGLDRRTIEALIGSQSGDRWRCCGRP
jgi:hypothetical protein